MPKQGRITAEKQFLVEAVEREIREGNYGRDPISMREWQRVFPRFLKSVDTFPRETGMEPHIRNMVLYLHPPATKDEARQTLATFFSEIAHECAEAAMCWEGRPPIYYPAEWGSHHDFAVLIQRRYLHRAERYFHEVLKEDCS